MQLHQIASYEIFRLTAFATLLLFTITNASWGQVASPLRVSPAASASGFQLDRIRIPSELGRIESRQTSSPGAPLIIFIQDAHAVLDAQANTRKLIRYLKGRYAVDLVAVEGGQGPFDVALFRSFPDEKVKKKVFTEYLQRAELSAPEMAAILDEEGIEYHGIENWRLYEENYLAYLAAMGARERLLAKLKILKDELDGKREAFYGPNLNAFHKHIEAFQEEKSNLVDLLKYLSVVAKTAPEGGGPKQSKTEIVSATLGTLPRNDVDMSKYPHLASLFNYLGQESALPRASVEMPVRRLAVTFSRKYHSKLDRKSAMDLNAANQAFASGQMDAGAFLKVLIEISRKIGLKPRLTAEMQEILGYTEMLSSLRGTKLFDELQEFLREMEERLITKPGERELARKYREIHLLNDLVNLELTRKDLETYQGNTESYLSILGEERERIKPALEFYRLVLERDRVFQKNLKSLLRRSNKRAVIFLAGGFHSGGFEKGLAGGPYSLLVVSPKMNSLAGKELYAGVMQGKISYKQYLQTTFYDAFARHASLSLVNGLTEPDFKKDLKLWRDELIRRLAREGRVGEAGEYTRYIDLLFKIYLGKFGGDLPPVSKEEVLKAVEKEIDRFTDETVNSLWKKFQVKFKAFTAGLQTLIEKKELNEGSVSALVDRVSQADAASLKEVAAPLVIRQSPPPGRALFDFFAEGERPVFAEAKPIDLPFASAENIVGAIREWTEPRAPPSHELVKTLAGTPAVQDLAGGITAMDALVRQVEQGIGQAPVTDAQAGQILNATTAGVRAVLPGPVNPAAVAQAIARAVAHRKRSEQRASPPEGVVRVAGRFDESAGPTASPRAEVREGTKVRSSIAKFRAGRGREERNRRNDPGSTVTGERVFFGSGQRPVESKPSPQESERRPPQSFLNFPPLFHYPQQTQAPTRKRQPGLPKPGAASVVTPLGKTPLPQSQQQVPPSNSGKVSPATSSGSPLETFSSQSEVYGSTGPKSTYPHSLPAESIRQSSALRQARGGERSRTRLGPEPVERAEVRSTSSPENERTEQEFLETFIAAFDRLDLSQPEDIFLLRFFQGLLGQMAADIPVVKETVSGHFYKTAILIREAEKAGTDREAFVALQALFGLRDSESGPIIAFPDITRYFAGLKGLYVLKPGLDQARLFVHEAMRNWLSIGLTAAFRDLHDKQRKIRQQGFFSLERIAFLGFSELVRKRLRGVLARWKQNQIIESGSASARYKRLVAMANVLLKRIRIIERKTGRSRRAEVRSGETKRAVQDFLIKNFSVADKGYFLKVHDLGFGIWQRGALPEQEKFIGTVSPFNFVLRGQTPAIEVGYDISTEAQGEGIISSFLETLSRSPFLSDETILVQTIFNPPTLIEIAEDLLGKGGLAEAGQNQIRTVLESFKRAIVPETILDQFPEGTQIPVKIFRKGGGYVDLGEYSSILPDSERSKLQLDLVGELAKVFGSTPVLKPAPQILWQTKLGRLAGHYGTGDIELQVEGGHLELRSTKKGIFPPSPRAEGHAPRSEVRQAEGLKTGFEKGGHLTPALAATREGYEAWAKRVLKAVPANRRENMRKVLNQFGLRLFDGKNDFRFRLSNQGIIENLAIVLNRLAEALEKKDESFGKDDAERLRNFHEVLVYLVPGRKNPESRLLRSILKNLASSDLVRDFSADRANQAVAEAIVEFGRGLSGKGNDAKFLEIFTELNDFLNQRSDAEEEDVKFPRFRPGEARKFLGDSNPDFELSLGLGGEGFDVIAARELGLGEPEEGKRPAGRSTARAEVRADPDLEDLKWMPADVDQSPEATLPLSASKTDPDIDLPFTSQELSRLFIEVYRGVYGGTDEKDKAWAKNKKRAAVLQQYRQLQRRLFGTTADKDDLARLSRVLRIAMNSFPSPEAKEKILRTFLFYPPGHPRGNFQTILKNLEKEREKASSETYSAGMWDRAVLDVLLTEAAEYEDDSLDLSSDLYPYREDAERIREFLRGTAVVDGRKFGLENPAWVLRLLDNPKSLFSGQVWKDTTGLRWWDLSNADKARVVFRQKVLYQIRIRLEQGAKTRASKAPAGPPEVTPPALSEAPPAPSLFDKGFGPFDLEPSTPPAPGKNMKPTPKKVSGKKNVAKKIKPQDAVNQLIKAMEEHLAGEQKKGLPGLRWARWRLTKGQALWYLSKAIGRLKEWLPGEDAPAWKDRKTLRRALNEVSFLGWTEFSRPFDDADEGRLYAMDTPLQTAYLDFKRTVEAALKSLPKSKNKPAPAQAVEETPTETTKKNEAGGWWRGWWRGSNKSEETGDKTSTFNDRAEKETSPHVAERREIKIELYEGREYSAVIHTLKDGLKVTEFQFPALNGGTIIYYLEGEAENVGYSNAYLNSETEVPLPEGKDSFDFYTRDYDYNDIGHIQIIFNKDDGTFSDLQLKKGKLLSELEALGPVAAAPTRAEVRSRDGEETAMEEALNPDGEGWWERFKDLVSPLVKGHHRRYRFLYEIALNTEEDLFQELALYVLRRERQSPPGRKSLRESFRDWHQRNSDGRFEPWFQTVITHKLDDIRRKESRYIRNRVMTELAELLAETKRPGEKDPSKLLADPELVEKIRQYAEKNFLPPQKDVFLEIFQVENLGSMKKEIHQQIAKKYGKDETAIKKMYYEAIREIRQAFKEKLIDYSSTTRAESRSTGSRFGPERARAEVRGGIQSRIPDTLRLNPQERGLVRRILEEIGNNAIRYAAERVLVDLQFVEAPIGEARNLEGWLEIEIEDDGRGFQMEDQRVRRGKRPVTTLGLRSVATELRGMLEKTEALETFDEENLGRALRSKKADAAYQIFHDFNNAERKEILEILDAMMTSPDPPQNELLRRFLFDLPVSIPRTVRQDVSLGKQASRGRGFGITGHFLRKLIADYGIRQNSAGRTRIYFRLPISSKAAGAEDVVPFREILSEQLSLLEDGAKKGKKSLIFTEVYIPAPRAEARHNAWGTSAAEDFARQSSGRAEVRAHRETVPREEPEEVPMPETVPAKPEPAPAPEREPVPLPEPAPAEPVPAEPDKELVPAGSLMRMRSEVRTTLDQINQIRESIERDPVNATKENLALILPYLKDSDGDVRRATLNAIASFVTANKDLATEPNLALILPYLKDSQWYVREATLNAIVSFIALDPALRSLLSHYREILGTVLVDHLGFPKAVEHAKERNIPLTELITLGAKVGAGTGEKKIAPADSDPARLAHWIIQHRNGDKIQELQISIGFDTSMLPSQEHRGKFIALFLFIASTYLKDFQALFSNPTRDPNAAYGLLIRGNVVDVRLPGQVKGRRLDYIFNLSREMTEKNLAELLRQIQLLNLGLLLATAEDSYQLFFPNETPAWMDARTRAIAEEYRKFERNLVKLLRDYDNFRDPDSILPSTGHPDLNQVWRNASMKYRHEEVLHPTYRWLQPLYQPDQYWAILLPLLRTIEGTIRSKKASDKPAVNPETGAEERLPVGLKFKRDFGMLGYLAMEEIEKLLSASSFQEGPKPEGHDPFIDDDKNEEATRYYLQQTADTIEQGRLSRAELPDTEAFDNALSNYGIKAKRSELRIANEAVILTLSVAKGKDPALGHVYEPPSGRKVLLARFFGLWPQNDGALPGAPKAHRETVPREEPEEVPMPETVPAEPEPAPAVPEKEPAPLPEPAPTPKEPEPLPAEPEKEPVPAGVARAEVRKASAGEKNPFWPSFVPREGQIMADLAANGNNVPLTEKNVWQPNAEREREKFRNRTGQQLRQLILPLLEDTADGLEAAARIHDDRQLAPEVLQTKLGNDGFWMNVPSLVNGLRTVVRGLFIPEAIAAPVAVGQEDFTGAQVIPNLIRGITGKTVVEFEMPELRGPVRTVLYESLMKAVLDTALLNNGIFTRIKVNSPGEKKELDRILGRLRNQAIARRLNPGQINVIDTTSRSVRLTEPVNVAVTVDPLSALNRQALSAFDSGAYLGGKHIENVTPAEFYLAAVATLFKQLIDGLVKDEKGIIKAKGPEVFNFFRMALQMKILAEAAREAMARAA